MANPEGLGRSMGSAAQQIFHGAPGGGVEVPLDRPGYELDYNLLRQGRIVASFGQSHASCLANGLNCFCGGSRLYCLILYNSAL